MDWIEEACSLMKFHYKLYNTNDVYYESFMGILIFSLGNCLLIYVDHFNWSFKECNSKFKFNELFLTEICHKFKNYNVCKLLIFGERKMHF